MTRVAGEFEEILDNIDVESYLDREGIDYKITTGSSGAQANIRECPECGNSNWKVYLNADSGFGNCFVCEMKFNKWSFIKSSLKGMTNGDVFRFIKHLSVEHGWRPKKTSYAVVENTDELNMPDCVDIPHNGNNLSYLTMRGIGIDITTYFNLKYSSNGKFWYKTDDGNVRFQDYSDRVLIPIYDIEGNLASFQGRDISGTSVKKYLFPPGFASTGKLLFNAHNAIGAKRIIINEGVFDVMATKIAIDEDISLRDVVPVGSFGKHLSNGGDFDQVSQFILLKHAGLKSVCFMWDGESLAIKAAIKAALILSSIGIRSSVAILPEGKDPNEVIGAVVREVYLKSTLINKKNAVRMLLKLGK